MNGELTVDFPEDVKIAIEPNQMATAELVGNRIKFSYCELDRAIAFLKDQYAIGTVEIKVVQPRSKQVIKRTTRSLSGELGRTMIYVLRTPVIKDLESLTRGC